MKVFSDPKHPYSSGLLGSFPSIKGPREPLTGIPGSPPDLAHPPGGCRFHLRCPKVMTVCRSVEPPFFNEDGAEVRCHLYASGG